MTKITILCENTACAPGILGEHGFSALIETSKGRYLFDTGQGNTLLHNARVLGIDLCRLDKTMLSHGHFDHTGGLAGLLKITGPMDVHAHPDIFTRRFALDKNKLKQKLRAVGMAQSRKKAEALGARFVFNTRFTAIADAVYLTGEIPRRTDFEMPDPRLVIKKAGELWQDPLNDDQSLILKTAKGLVIIFGCAHAGIINTLNHVKNKMPREKVHLLLGGTHLGYLNDTQIEKSIEHLKSFSADKIGVCHCTGWKASLRIMNAFGKQFFVANAGQVINI